MRNFDDISEKIDQYLLGELEGDVLSEFEKSLENDDELSEEVEFRRKLIYGTKSLGRERLKAKIQRIETEVEQENSPSQVKRIWLISGVVMAAAAIILLFMMVRGAEFQPRVPAMGSSVTMGRPGSSKEEIKNAYDAGDYSKAIELIEAYIQESPEDTWMKMYQAICYWEIGEYNKAETTLKSMDQIKAADRLALVQWYLALTYWKQGKIEVAKTALDQIPNDFREQSVIQYKELMTILNH